MTRIEFGRDAVCRRCRGTGLEHGASCPACKGTGIVRRDGKEVRDGAG